MSSFSICIPLLHPTAKLVTKASSKADLIELWIDELSQETARKLIKTAKTSVLVTCKKANAVDRLSDAILAGADFVDCESDTPIKEIGRLKQACKKKDAVLVLSTHFWKKTPTLVVLERHALSLKKKGADIVKIATMLQNPTDTVTLFELATRLKKRKVPFVIVGMGRDGVVSRIGCAILGGEWTYIALDEKTKTAPGQITISELQSLALARS